MEIWKDIDDYQYEVSNTGNVRHKIKKNILNQTESKGYKKVNLFKSGESKTFPVHRLVAKAFLQDIPSKGIVNHKNLIKSDNRVENLEWMTIRENNNHYLSNKLLSRKIKIINRITNELVAEYNMSDVYISKD